MSTAPNTSKAMAWWVWSLAVFFVVYLFSIQTGYAIVSSAVKADLGITVGQVGTIAAMYTWVFAFCQLFGGPLLDRLGAHKVLVPAIALVAAGAFVFANAQAFSHLLVSQIILAVGACVGFVGAGYIGGQWFGMARFSFMFGLVQFCASLFSTFNQNIILLALEHTTWRHLFNGIGVLGIALFGLAAIYLRNPTPVAVSAEQEGFISFFVGILRKLLAAARSPQLWLAALVGALCFGVMLSLGVVWGPKLLQARGIEAAAASSMASLLWLGLAVGCVVIPWCSDRFKMRKLPVIVGALVQAAAVVALVYVPVLSDVQVVALCLVFGFANAVHMLGFSIAGDIMPPEQIGTSAAIVNGAMFLMAGVLMSSVGERAAVLIEAGATDRMVVAQAALLPIVMAMGLAVVLSFLLKESYPTQNNH